MQNIKVSIIIPVYNVKEYVEKCIESVLNQTYKNIEVIIINDGSTDGCEKIVNKYAQKDKRIKVINKENGGLASARNIGLKLVTGNYVMFVDSDDWIAENTIEKLYKELKKEKYDIIEFGYTKVDEKSIIVDGYKFYEKKLLSNESILKEYFSNNIIQEVVWNKIYNRNILQGISMQEGRIYEDYMVMPEILINTNELLIIPDIFYSYLQRRNSIVHSKFSKKNLDWIYAGNYVIDFCNKNIKKYEYAARLRKIMLCVQQYNELIKSDIETNEKIKYKNIILKEFKKDYTEAKKMNILKKEKMTKRMLYYLFNIMPSGTCVVLNIFKGYKILERKQKLK